MTDKLSVLMHYSSILTGERMAAGVLAVVLVGMFFYHEKRKSTLCFFITLFLETVQVFADSETYCYSINEDIPLWLAVICYFISYSFGPLVMAAFACYAEAFIGERTAINKWLFRIPVLLSVINFLVIAGSILAGTVYEVSDGKVASVGSVPLITNMISLALILYIPAASVAKVKEIGWKVVVLLGLFGILPAFFIYFSYDYSLMAGAVALLIVYIFLQNDVRAEKEKRAAELSNLNNRLRAANEEEKTQLEEITALNEQLEENQSELEASSSEQEAQIEEINELNRVLTEQKETLAKQMDAVRSLSKLYYASYYLDMDNDVYYELLNPNGTQKDGEAYVSQERTQDHLNELCASRIDPEYFEAMKSFVDLSTLSERMKDTDAVSIRVRMATGDWARVRFITGSRHENGTLKSCTFVARNINAEIAEEQKRNDELNKALNLAQEATAEQEAQLEEITALNTQLENNQAELEASVAEQEAQIQEITELNAGIEQARKKAEDESRRVSEAYGMIEGLSQDYHTIWLVDKETSKMHLIRSSGKSTIQRAVRMGIDEPLFDPAFDNYIGSCVEPEDRERMHREIAFAEILRQLRENPGKLYAVNYLRRDDSGHVGYHQIAFANAIPQTERNSSSTASAMWIRWSGKSRPRRKN